MEIPLKLPKLRERFFKNTPSTLRKVLFFDRFRRVEALFFYFCGIKSMQDDYRKNQRKGKDDSGVSV